MDAERAAELGLAQAVLRWERIGSGFETHARAVIATQLRRASTGCARRHRRHQQVANASPRGPVRAGVRRRGISHPQRQRPRMSRGGKPRAPAEPHVGPVGRGCGSDPLATPGPGLFALAGYRICPSAGRHDTNIDIDSMDDGACWLRDQHDQSPKPSSQMVVYRT